MEIGSTVTLAYKGTLEDGTMFGYADEEKPLKFQTGMDMVIDGLEREIMEMEEVGQKRTFTLGIYDAYGEYLEDFTQKIKIEQIPFAAKPGKRIWINDEEMGKTPATIIDVKDGEAIVDMNHPLAGHELTYEIEILDIEEPPENFVSAAERKAEQKRLSHMVGGGGANPDAAMYYE